MTLPSELPSRSRRLLEIAPRLDTVAPRVTLADLPTPVTEHAAFASRFGLAALHVKRDNLTSTVYGGTKVRALEFLLGRALHDRAGGVATIGANGSHHVLATAIFAERLGLRMRAVLVPQPAWEGREGRLAWLQRHGVEAIEARTWPAVPPSYIRGRWGSLGGKRPAWIPAGGTSAVGALGAVEGMLEVADAIKAGTFEQPDCIVVAAGSCGTAAGILAGCALAGITSEVIAIRVVPRVMARRGRVFRVARAALALLATGGATTAALRFAPLQMVHREIGGRSAVPTEAGRVAVACVRDATGLIGDTTYTGKAWAHILGGHLRGRRVLFWNTLSATAPG